MGGMFSAIMGRQQGALRAGSRSHSCPLHLFQRALKGEGAVHVGGFWGPSYSLQAGAGRASISKRPREPMCVSRPGLVVQSGPCPLFKSTCPSPTLGAGRERKLERNTAWKGGDRCQMHSGPCPAQPGCQSPTSCLQPPQRQEAEVLFL